MYFFVAFSWNFWDFHIVLSNNTRSYLWKTTLLYLKAVIFLKLLTELIIRFSLNVSSIFWMSFLLSYHRILEKYTKHHSTFNEICYFSWFLWSIFLGSKPIRIYMIEINVVIEYFTIFSLDHRTIEMILKQACQKCWTIANAV